MQIRIVGPVMAEAEIDLNIFKMRLVETGFDFVNSVADSVRIIKSLDSLNEREFKLSIWYALDWQRILEQLTTIEKDKIRVFVYNAKSHGWNRFRPGLCSSDKRNYELSEEISDVDTVIYMQDYIIHPSYNIKGFIDNLQLTYDKEEDVWDVVPDIQQGS